VKKQELAGALLVGALLIVGAAVLLGTDTAAAPTVDGNLGTVAFHSLNEQDPGYVGGRSGCRTCHLREYRAWDRTPHANALEALPEESREDPACLKCHTTGYGTDSGFTSVADTPALAGVGCESCHGPGSVYRDEDIMKSQDAAVAAGLHIPTEATCLGCHNDESPTFPGTFNFEEMKEKGVHPTR